MKNTFELWAVCHGCKQKHSLHSEAQGAYGYWTDWLVKHPGHDVQLVSERNPPEWKGYRHNADVKEAYATSAAYTITLASLASSATLVAGRESTAVSNTTNKYLDYLVGGKITTGTTPTVDKTIEIWLYGSVDDTPTYPDVFDGTDSAETITSENVKAGSLKILDRLFIDATSDRAYWFGPIGIARAFGGRVPKNHGIFVTHDTGVALNATGGNHAISHTGQFNTVI